MCDRCEHREASRSSYRRKTAGKLGRKWTRPMAQPLDGIAVELAMSGQRVSLSAADCYEVVRRLTLRGLSAREIGERLGMTARSVVRWRGRPQPVEKACAQPCGLVVEESDSDDSDWTQGTKAA